MFTEFFKLRSTLHTGDLLAIERLILERITACNELLPPGIETPASKMYREEKKKLEILLNRVRNVILDI